MECSKEVNDSRGFSYEDFFSVHFSEKYNKKVILIRYVFFSKQNDYTDLND